MFLLTDTKSTFASRLSEAIDSLVSDGIIINPAEMIIQLAATILLIVVVKYFFWDKVTAFIEGRREVVDRELTEATEKNQEADALKEEAEKQLMQVKQEAKSILDESKSRGEDTRREIIAKAKDEAQTIKKSAQKDLAQDIEVARRHLRDEIIEVATLLSQKAMSKDMNKKTYDRLVDEAIDEVSKQ